MFIYEELAVVGKIDISPLKGLIDSIDEEIWSGDLRSRVSNQWAASQSLWFILCPLDDNGTFYTSNRIDKTFKNYPELVDVIKKIHIDIEECFKGKLIQSTLVRLKPGTTVGIHVDGYCDRFRYPRRYIIPVEVNDNCSFFTDPIVKGRLEHRYLEEGIVYEINPFVPHGTQNKGSTNRYHLVVDIILEEDRQAYNNIKSLDFEGPAKNLYKNNDIPIMSPGKSNSDWRGLLDIERDKYEVYVENNRTWKMNK